MMFVKTIRNFSLALSCLVALSSGVGAQPSERSYVYKTPEEAVSALIAATKADDKVEILAILGTNVKDLIDSGDETADSSERETFVAAYEEKHAIVRDKEGRAILEVGAQSWPFPIPLVLEKKDNEWVFDGKTGIEEVLDRRIGRNELSAIEVMSAYVDAQGEYYRLNPDQSVVRHFAPRIASRPGKHDGLYWQTGEGEKPSPLGPLVAQAEREGYAAVSQDVDRPYHGYRYRVLTGQGKHAKGGAYSYIEDDLMFGGFGLIAYPDTYGVSGVMTFIVNQDGVVYEKNLGQDTAVSVRKIDMFDPDDTWHAFEFGESRDK